MHYADCKHSFFLTAAGRHAEQQSEHDTVICCRFLNLFYFYTHIKFSNPFLLRAGEMFQLVDVTADVQLTAADLCIPEQQVPRLLGR